jgi:hypothetical protein
MLPLSPAAIAFLLAACVSALGSNLLYSRLCREVNATLPPENQWSEWGNYPGKTRAIMKVHRSRHPESRLRTMMYVFEAVALVNAACFAYLLLQTKW